MNPLNKSGHLSHLSQMCINHSKLMTRMALICFQTNKYPAAVEMTLVFLKYIQLISQVILFNFYLHGYSESYASDWYSRGVIFIAKLFNPAFWMPYENRDLLVFCVLIGIMCFMALRYSLFAYVVWVAYKDRDGDPRLIRIWGYVFKIQGRVFYSLLSTFFVNTILTFSSSGLKTPGIGRVGLIIWCVLMIVAEYSFSIFLQIRFCYALPARGLLGCKDNRTEMILLSQKLAIHMLAIVLKKYSTTSLWVFSSINLLFCIGRDWEYFTGLPFYNLWTLKYQGVLLEVFTSLNVACFIQSIAKSSNFGEVDMAFILVVWIITGALFIKLAVQYLENIKIQVIMEPRHASPDLLTHKVSVIRHLRSVMQMPAAANKKYQWSYLLNRSINANIQTVLDIGEDFAPDVELDINSKTSINRMILNYLEHLSKKYPKNNFLRLYIAYFYAKKLRLYGNAVKIITELQQHSHSNAVVNASLLIYEIQNVLKAEYQNDDTQLDLFTFSISQAYNAQLKIKMLEQADTQINICTEVIKDIPDLSKIFNWSQKLEVSRKNIERKMEGILKVIPEYYIQPILTASEYNLKLNHSYSAYAKYRKMFTSRYQKYEKGFRSIKLNKENLYQDNSVFLQLAGNKTDAGKIIFCTKAVQNVFGGDSDNYIGSQIFSLLPSSLQPYYSDIFQKLLQEGDRKTINKQDRNFFYHKDGSIIEGDFYVNIHPFLTRSFCLNMVIRPVPFYNDYMLVKENGDIEGVSKKIGQKLGLLFGRSVSHSHMVNLRQLNADLVEINDIFNIMSYPGMTFEDKVKEREKRSKSLKSQASSNEIFEMKKKNSKRQAGGSLHGNSRLNHTSAKDDYEFYERALTLYNIYSAGKDVSLTSLKRRDEDDEGSSNSNYRIYSYHCKIENLTFGTTKMKIFTMEENRNRHDMVNDEAGALTAKTNVAGLETSKLTPNMSFEGDFQQQQKSARNSKEPSDNGFYDLKSEDDANDLEAGDFQSLMLFKSIRPEEPLTSSGPEPAKNLDSPYTPGDDLQTAVASPVNKMETILTTVNNETYPTQEAYSLPLLNPAQVSVKPQQAKHFEKKMSGKPMHIDQSNSTQSENEDPNAPNKVEKSMKKFLTENSIAASAKSRSVRTKKLSDAYLSALNSKYYPKFFNLACLLLYVALIATFSTQIQLKSTIDSTLTELTVKKEVLSNAQNRNFMLVLLEALFRMVWNLYGGRLTASDLGIVGIFIPSFMSTGVGVLESLAKVNQALLVNTNSMDAERRDMMFIADVRVYDNYFDSSDQSYERLTSFQATESLVQSGLKVVANQNDLSKVKDELDFIFRNSLNDLLIKNEDISTLFLKALNEQKDNIEKIVDIFMISDIVALGFVAVLFSLIIWKQYQREKTNMFAVTKLNTAKVEQVIENLYYFKRSLENERKNDDEDGVESRRTSKIVGASKAKGKDNQKKEHMKVPKYTGLRWRYYRFTGELFIFVVVIIALVLINSFVDRDSINFFQDKESQLYFTDRMKSRFFIDTITSQELLAVDNDIAMIENTLCSEYINYAIQDVANLRIQAAAIYKDSNGVMNSQIREILYTNGCNLSGSFYTSICSYIESQGVQTGLIYLLDKMELLISNIQQRYELSDKSTSSLVAIQTTDYSLFTFIELLLAGQCQEISDILNADFDDETSASKTRRNAVLIVFSIMMVILCILIWIYVLKKIKEADNQFKIVLKSFPAGLVLSSFILKRFLIETSTGALDSVKNDI